MNIFESLENLNVSEECFDDIMSIVEEILGEGYNLAYVVGRAMDKKRLPKFKKGTELTTYSSKADKVAHGDRSAKLMRKAQWEVPDSEDRKSEKQYRREYNNTPGRASGDLMYKLNQNNQGFYYDKDEKDSPENQEVVELAKNKSIRRNAAKKIKELTSNFKKKGFK